MSEVPPLPDMRSNFWKDAEIIQLDTSPAKKCEHEFKYAKDGVICMKCHFGLIAHDLEIRSGKLFARGEPVGL